MLSLFPELLFLAPLSAFVIRVVLGLMLGIVAYHHVFLPRTSMRILGIVEGVLALLLIAGAYTQAAAIIALVLLACSIGIPSWRTFPRGTIMLLAVLALSLIVTGAGPFAFDLPL